MWPTLRRTTWTVALLTACALGPACTAEGEPPQDPSDRTRSRLPDKPPDPLEVPTVPLTTTQRLSFFGTTHRTGSGLTMLTYSLRSQIRSAFRIYDRQWRPITPLLRVNSTLLVERSTRSSFVARVDPAIRNGRRTLGPVVVITRDGTVHAAAHQFRRGDGRHRVRVGDVPLVTAVFPPIEVYRPRQDRVFLRTMPAWYRPFDQSWSTDSNRIVCTFTIPSTGRAPIGTDLHSSTDSGLRWRATPTASISAATGPRVLSCLASRTRVVVTTGEDGGPRWDHTLRRDDGHVLSTRPLGARADWHLRALLPDGVLVEGTNRRGLRFGTDSTNKSMVFRPGPIDARSLWWIVGRDIVAASPDYDVLYVSSDAGRTWQRVDLSMPPDT